MWIFFLNEEFSSTRQKQAKMGKRSKILSAGQHLHDKAYSLFIGTRAINYRAQRIRRYFINPLIF